MEILTSPLVALIFKTSEQANEQISGNSYYVFVFIQLVEKTLKYSPKPKETSTYKSGISKCTI